MKPTRDHDHILKSRLVQRQSTRQPAQVQIKMLLQWALGDDTDAGRSLSNPRSLSTYLSNFVVVLWNKIMKMLSLTRSLTHSLSLYHRWIQTMPTESDRAPTTLSEVITYTQSLTPLSTLPNHPNSIINI
jgi:hypothetical protein